MKSNGNLLIPETQFEESVLRQYDDSRIPSDMLYTRSESKDGVVRVTVWLGYGSANARVVGSMNLEPTVLVHGLEVDEGMLQRKIADALFQYASGYVRASGFSEALVLVGNENERMQRYVETRAVPEEPSKAYLMEVK